MNYELGTMKKNISRKIWQMKNHCNHPFNHSNRFDHGSK